MGRFASDASKYDLESRINGDGFCAAGRWIAANMDDDDLAEFVRLANGHRWRLILGLSNHELKADTLQSHVHGSCPCFAGNAAKGCCACDKTVKSADQRAS